MRATWLIDPVESAGKCFFCGAPADVPLSRVLKSTFSALNEVAVPGSELACRGCEWAMGTHDALETYGETRVGRAAQPRLYSWLVTATRRVGYTKAHRSELRELCLRPPDPPYSLCLSDSGQKHLLYLSPVCCDAEVPTVSLEGEAVSYRREDLAEALRVATEIVRVSGKPALTGGFDGRRLVDAVGPESAERIMESWEEIRGTSLGRLVSWICPSKEEALACEDDRHRTVPA